MGTRGGSSPQEESPPIRDNFFPAAEKESAGKVAESGGGEGFCTAQRGLTLASSITLVLTTSNGVVNTAATHPATLPHPAA